MTKRLLRIMVKKNVLMQGAAMAVLTLLVIVPSTTHYSSHPLLATMGMALAFVLSIAIGLATTDKKGIGTINEQQKET